MKPLKGETLVSLDVYKRQGYKNHLCAIVGDKGIHQFVDVAYWQLQCDLMIEQFKQKEMCIRDRARSNSH